MRVYKRGDVYWYELVFNGKRIQRSTKSKNQRTAGQIASAYFTSLVKGEVGIIERKPVPTFAKAMKDFLEWSEREHVAHPETAARYKYSSLPLLKFFKDRPLDQISAEDVESYKTRRSREKSRQSGERLRPATVNRELACLRRMINHTTKGNPELRNPVSQVKFTDEDNQQTRVLSFIEQKAYLAECTPLLRNVATIILETGMRPGEVFELTPRVIDIDRGYLRIEAGKTKAARRQIELTIGAKAILRPLIEAAAGGYLFPNERDVSRCIESVQGAHTRALADSRVSPFRLYDLRHTWATRAAQSGIDLVTLAAMMGHARIQMVLRYAHPTQTHQAAAMEKLAEYNALTAKQEDEKARLAAGNKAAEPRLRIVPRTA